MDLIGHTYGRLTVVARGAPGNAWRCTCVCGGTKTALASNLRGGKTKSCGCIWREQATKHGAAGTRTYVSWRSMINRCTNPVDPSFCRYGGAGVKVAPAWMDYSAFIADLGERPEGKTIDRWPNPAGNYEPGNCRWATNKEQQRNKVNPGPQIETPLGPMTVCEASDASGISPNLLRARRRAGWPVARLFSPVNHSFSHPKR